MKKLIITLIIGLTACSAPLPKPAALEEPAIVEAPALAVPPCPTDEDIAHDGIGGTGCQ